MTIKERVKEAKIRKGRSHGTDASGAYWLSEVKVAAAGGDGIGNNSADVSFYAQIRHYRDGDIVSRFVRESWHQNYGTSRKGTRADFLQAETWEEIEIAFAKAAGREDWERSAFSSAYSGDWEGFWKEIPEAPPAPDDSVLS